MRIVDGAPFKTNAAERARWLADLARAIEDAQRLLWQLGVSEGDSADAKQLYGRLETVRAEVESLRGGWFREISEEIAPDWVNLLLTTPDFDAAI
jgi:hypothetical protein